jgi:hypothetical protein
VRAGGFSHGRSFQLTTLVISIIIIIIIIVIICSRFFFAASLNSYYYEWPSVAGSAWTLPAPFEWSYYCNYVFVLSLVSGDTLGTSRTAFVPFGSSGAGNPSSVVGVRWSLSGSCLVIGINVAFG